MTGVGESEEKGCILRRQKPGEQMLIVSAISDRSKSFTASEFHSISIDYSYSKSKIIFITFGESYRMRQCGLVTYSNRVLELR